MSTVSFKESLKYGGRLFALWLGVTILGSAFTALGGYLGVSELQTLITDGTAAVETATLAAGAILAVLGGVTLLIGNFALVYKLLADAVSRGRLATSTEPIESAAGAATTEEGGTAEAVQTEQAAAEPQPDQPESPSEQPRPASSEEPSQQPAEVPASEQPTAETVRQPDERGEKRPAAGTEGTGPTEQPVAESPANGGQPQEPAATSGSDQSSSQRPEQAARDQSTRERTAEEIAFGAEGDDTGSEETTSVDDDEWFDEEAGEDSEMFDEEPEEEIDRSNIETANDSSADPLGDQFENK